MIDIDPPPPFSAFVRWMRGWMTRGARLRKGASAKNVVLAIIFS